MNTSLQRNFLLVSFIWVLASIILLLAGAGSFIWAISENYVFPKKIDVTVSLAFSTLSMFSLIACVKKAIEAFQMEKRKRTALRRTQSRNENFRGTKKDEVTLEEEVEKWRKVKDRKATKPRHATE